MWSSRASNVLPSLYITLRQAKPTLPCVTSLTLTPSRTITMSTVLRSSGGSWRYRQLPANPSFKAEVMGEIFCGFMWWWVLYHLWHESEHITGEWPIVDPSKWTDEQLGIPPDSVGPAPRIQY